MESNSEDDNKSIVNKDQPFNSEEAAALLELSPRQKAFADHILMGCTQTRAAEMAGYSGEDSTLRSTASRVMASEKVQAYLAWARNGKAGLPDNPATIAEIERKLSEHLRGSDKNASIRASELLTKLHIAREEADRNATQTPTEVLDDMAKLGPIGLGLAMWVSRATGVAWKAPDPASDGTLPAFEAALHAQLTPAEQARVDYVANLQNSLGHGSVDGQGRCSSSDAPSTVQRPVSLDPPESWLTDGGHPARVVGALTREQAIAAAALNRNYRRR